MKLRNLFLCAFAAAAALVGCNKENGGEQTGSLDITLSTEKLEFGAEKSTQTVEVTTGREWKATYDAPEGGAWFSVSPETAKGNQVVEIGVSANDGYDRSAEIKFSNGLKNKTLKITQKGKSSFTTIAEVRAMYQGSTVNVADGIKVKGVVISNMDLNNLTSKKSLYVQDATAGINVYCAANHSFAFGDEVVFNLSGAELTEFSGLLEINKYDATKAEKVGTSTPEAKVVSVDDFLAGKYQGQYVAIENCQVASGDLSKKWCNDTNNHTSITVEHQSGKSFVVFTSKYATTLTEVPQGSGTIKGIASVGNSASQLIFAQKSDPDGMTGARFEGPETQEMAIADVFTTTETAAKVKGSVVAAGTKSIVINDGGDKNLYVYINAEHNWKVGDAVLVEGTISKYGKTGTGYTQLIQISKPTITAYSGTVTPKSETAAELTAAQIDAPYTNASSPKIKVNATVVVSGNYRNLDFGGTVQGSVVASSLDSELTDGKAVEIIGYYAGVNTSGYLSILPVEVKASSASFFGVSDQSLNVAASATSATFNVTGNVAWTASSSNANFKVEPASGNGAAAVTVTFPANTDTEKTVTANITVSTTANVATKSFTVAITQAKAEGAGTMTVVLDATDGSFPADFPATGDNANDYQEYTIGGYVWGFSATTKYAYYSSDKYFLWGKKDSYILLPAIEGKSLTSVTILTGKGASMKVEVGVYKADGSAAVKGGEKILLNAQNSEFSWSLSETTPNTKYQLRVCNSNNAQFQKLTLKYK